MSATVTLRVRRGAKGEAPRFEDFAVPYTAGMSVLDALMWIRSHVDGSLAVRYSCINANACKECMMRIDEMLRRLRGTDCAGLANPGGLHIRDSPG